MSGIDVTEIARRTGIDPRVMRYVLEHGAVAFARKVGRGRGTARRFTEAQAFLLALAALMFRAGLRRSAVVDLIDDLSRHFKDSEGDLLFGILAPSPEVSQFIEIADGLNFRTRRIGGNTSKWLQIGTRAPLLDAYQPLVVVGFDAAELGRRLFNPG